MSEEEPLRIYFACVGNSGRSQIAEAFCRELGGDLVECASGGTEPYGQVLPLVEEAMNEVGIDVSEQESTPIDEGFVERSDLVVTMGCGADACPAFHGAEVHDWPLADPKDQDIETVRGIRDGIEGRVRELLAERGVLDTPEA